MDAWEGHDVLGERTGREGRRGRRRAALVGGAAVLAVVAVLAVGLPRGAPRGSGVQVPSQKAKRSLIAALGTTDAAGSYDVSFTLHASSPTTPRPCAVVPVTPGAQAASGPGPRVYCAGITSPVDVSGHATVNQEPYALFVVSTVSNLGPITLYVNGTTVWELGGGNYGSSPSVPGGAGPGSPLSGFANLVEGTLGPGQGALTMISL